MRKGVGLISLIFSCLIVGYIFGKIVDSDYKDDSDFWESKADSLFSVLKAQDSLIINLNKKQDSLIESKKDSIIKIKEVYDSEINYINLLNVDLNVELLSRNISQDTSIEW